MSSSVYDILGIGFGPANVALAIALEERGRTDGFVFLEQAEGPSWQNNMLLDGADIQNNPIRDLVSPRNPRSRYSFINFLHEHKRLYEYLNLGIEYPLRKEYAQYIVWVADHFASWVRYNQRVAHIGLERLDGSTVYAVKTASGEIFRARSVVAAPGRTPLIPEPFDKIESERIFHLTRYRTALRELDKQFRPLNRLCVVGGSQSAIEIVLDLIGRYPKAEILNIQRGYGFQLKDTSPFSDRVYFPEHVDYYFDASPASKRDLDAQLKRSNYSSADGDVIRKLYLTLYEQRLDGDERVRVITNTAVRSIDVHEHELSLEIEEMHRHGRDKIQADAVVLATGFRNFGSSPHQERIPELLTSLSDLLETDSEGVLKVERDYRLRDSSSDRILPPIFLNGLCESSHGMGDAGSFSMLALRSDLIVQSLEKALLTTPRNIGRLSPRSAPTSDGEWHVSL